MCDCFGCSQLGVHEEKLGVINGEDYMLKKVPAAFYSGCFVKKD
jgi:hypothetical protein